MTIINRLNGILSRSILQCCKNVIKNDDMGNYSSRQFNFVRSMASRRILQPERVYASDQKEELVSVFPEIVDDLTKIDEYRDIPEIAERFAKAMDYNLLYGSKFVGCTTVIAYKMLEDEKNLTPDNIRLGNILGWCMEMHIMSLIMADDLFDNSQMRRDHPCWYKVDGVGFQAFNDAKFIAQGILILVKKHFRNHPFYRELMDLMNYGFYRFAFSFALDGTSTKEFHTPYVYSMIEKYTSAAYTYTIPGYLAMYFSKVYTPELDKQSYPVFYDLGGFFYTENGMWDVFADEIIIGKIGSDIQEGRCSFVQTTAMRLANENQRKIMEEHYGKPNAKSEAIIKDLFEELDIIGEFFKYREKVYDRMKQNIERVTNKKMKMLLTDFCVKLMERKYDIAWVDNNA